MGSPSDFLNRLVIAPSLSKGPKNFALNEPVVFDPDHPHARNLVAWMPLNGLSAAESAFNNPVITFSPKNSNYTHSVTDRNIVGDFSSGDTALYVDDPNGPILTGGNALSLSCWVRLTADAFSLSGTKDVVLVRKRGVYSLGIFPWTSKCRFLLGTTGGTTGWTADNDFTKVLIQDRWTHLVLDWDGSKVRAYFDGILKASFTVTGNLVSNSDATCLGYDKENDALPELPGYMYDVRIYDRSLSPSEIFEISQGVQPVKSAIPLGIPVSEVVATGPVYYNQSDVSVYYGSTSVTGIYRGSSTIWTP